MYVSTEVLRYLGTEIIESFWILSQGTTVTGAAGRVGWDRAAASRMGAVQATHSQGSPNARSQPAQLRRRQRAALAARSSSQVGLCSGRGGCGVCCAAGVSVSVKRAGAGAGVGAGGRRTEGAGRGAFAAELEAPAEVAMRRRLVGWIRTGGKGCVRENGVPRAAASSWLSSSPRT
eukprot:35238-Pleurochrysis_carterae.AAC.1